MQFASEIFLKTFLTMFKEIKVADDSQSACLHLRTRQHPVNVVFLFYCTRFVGLFVSCVRMDKISVELDGFKKRQSFFK